MLKKNYYSEFNYFSSDRNPNKKFQKKYSLLKNIIFLTSVYSQNRIKTKVNFNLKKNTLQKCHLNDYLSCWWKKKINISLCN